MVELKLFIFELVSYLFISGAVYFVFYVLLKEIFKHRIIQKKFENKDKIFEEIKYSMSSVIVFTLTFIIAYRLQEMGITKNYKEVSEYGVWYLFFSVFLMVVIHDTYFYWAHRLMHHPALYKHVHLVHHRSTNPSPFASHFFHPLEAFAEIGIIYVLIFTIPYHNYAIAMWWAYMMFINVMGHLSIEVFPNWFLKIGLLKFHNSPTHHNMHHKYFNYNYGLYFNIWDRLMKTEHPKYMETFDEVTSRLSEKEMEELKQKEMNNTGHLKEKESAIA